MVYMIYHTIGLTIEYLYASVLFIEWWCSRLTWGCSSPWSAIGIQGFSIKDRILRRNAFLQRYAPILRSIFVHSIFHSMIVMHSNRKWRRMRIYHRHWSMFQQQLIEMECRMASLCHKRRVKNSNLMRMWTSGRATIDWIEIYWNQTKGDLIPFEIPFMFSLIFHRGPHWETRRIHFFATQCVQSTLFLFHFFHSQLIQWIFRSRKLNLVSSKRVKEHRWLFSQSEQHLKMRRITFCVR